MVYANDVQSLKMRWISGVDIISNEKIKQDELIDEPRGTLIRVFELIFLDKNFLLHKDCVVYKVPRKGETGELSVIALKYRDKCDDRLFDKKIFEIENIYNFSYKLDLNNLFLNIDENKFQFKLKNKILSYDYQLFDTSKNKSEEPGVLISFFDSKESGYKLKNDDICFDTNDKCEQMMPDLCHLCPDRVIPVISNKCQNKTRKYCSMKNCGIPGGPACIRGLKGSAYLGDYCIADSPIAYCLKPSRVICVEGELLCR